MLEGDLVFFFFLFSSFDRKSISLVVSLFHVIKKTMTIDAWWSTSYGKLVLEGKGGGDGGSRVSVSLVSPVNL